ncbi:MAG: efflux RND transporter periplasmic adaptor subunit [Pseudomonadota bacterium]
MGPKTLLTAGLLIGAIAGVSVGAGFSLLNSDGSNVYGNPQAGASQKPAAQGRTAQNPRAQNNRAQSRGNNRAGGFRMRLPAVSVGTVSDGGVSNIIETIGEARALRSVTLVTETAGVVAASPLAPGSVVKKGDVLLQLDDREQQIELLRARSQYPIAKSNADRYAELEKDEAASALEAEQAYNAFKIAEADLRAAELAVSRRKVIAPFDGVVGLSDIEAGDFVSAAAPVVTLDDTSSMIIAFFIPQEAAGNVALGQAVEARLSPSARAVFSGVVSARDSRVDLASRTLGVEARFENKNGALLPGATYTVTTKSQGARGLALSGLAMQWDRSGPYVWALDAAGAVARVPVTVLQRNDEDVIVAPEIANGLGVGDRIIVEGSDRIRPGMVFAQYANEGNGRTNGFGAPRSRPDGSSRSGDAGAPKPGPPKSGVRPDASTPSTGLPVGGSNQNGPNERGAAGSRQSTISQRTLGQSGASGAGSMAGALN